MVSKAVAGTVCLWIWSVIFQHSNQIQTSQVLRLILKKACRTFKIKYRLLYNWLHFQIRFCFSFFSLLSYISQNIHEDSLVNGINQSNNPFIPKSPCSIMWKVRPWHCFLHVAPFFFGGIGANSSSSMKHQKCKGKIKRWLCIESQLKVPNNVK